MRSRDYVMPKMDRSVAKVNGLVLFELRPECSVKLPALSVGIRWKQEQACKHPVQATTEATARKTLVTSVVKSFDC